MVASFIPVEIKRASGPETFVSGSRTKAESPELVQAGSICAIFLFQVAVVRQTRFQN
jgi:hypothetical protein